MKSVLNIIQKKSKHFATLSLFLILFIFTIYSAGAQISDSMVETVPSTQQADSTETGIDIDSIMSEMTLDEKIGQLFMVRAYGRFSNDRDLDYLRLKELITDYHVGGDCPDP